MGKKVSTPEDQAVIRERDEEIRQEVIKAVRFRECIEITKSEINEKEEELRGYKKNEQESHDKLVQYMIKMDISEMIIGCRLVKRSGPNTLGSLGYITITEVYVVK